MLEYGVDDVLFRILRRGNNAAETHPNFRTRPIRVRATAAWRRLQRNKPRYQSGATRSSSKSTARF